MEKYKLVSCCGCGVEFQKENRYVKIAEKKGRKHYCSLKCHGKTTRNEKLGEWVTSENNKNFIKSLAGNRKDDYTPFRTLLKSCRTRTNKSGNSKGDFDLDLPYLKQLWEQQNLI